MSKRVLAFLAAVLGLATLTGAAATHTRAAAARTAHARPAATTTIPQPDWLPADKQGFGTATSPASKVWFTLEGGELSEVYYPRLDTPSFRDLQFVVSDGRSFATPENGGTVHQIVVPDAHSLIFRQVNTDRDHRWRIVKTYVTDPARATVLVRVTFQSLTGKPYRLYVVADPALDNSTVSETGTCTRSALLAHGGHMASAVLTAPTVTESSCGSADAMMNPLNQLEATYTLVPTQRTASSGHVVEVARTTLTGLRAHRTLTLALAFAGTPSSALTMARRSLRVGWASIARRYGDGWHRYLASLRQPPASLRTAAERREYALSEMVLAASEDKTYTGAYVASPTMPWAWGTGLQTPSGPYHLVWARDLYEIATALIADGDRAGARRALQFLLTRQERADGSFPQNSDVAGHPVLTNLQLDEVADPMILAWQLGATDPATWSHVKRAADFLLGWHDTQGHTAPYTPQERWENQAGYSPATIAAEIAGLVCAADLARRDGDTADAKRYLATADAWRAHLNGWTLTTTGPYGGAYYLRLTKDGNPNAGTTYSIGDSGPAAIDQRAVVDPSFLELVRLGVIDARDPNIKATIGVVDRRLGVSTPQGTFWHRYTDDGYGEQRSGAPWNVGFPAGSQTTIGRLWPIFAGERGEYELAAGQRADARLGAMAAAANAAGLLPEQVWDDNPPAGPGGVTPGTPTTSATPLAWTHAQFIRLAWSIAAGAPVEQPSIVACRYVRRCAG